jgi:hypothetical protein
MQPRKVLFPLVLVGFCVLLVTVAGLGGYWVARRWPAHDQPWSAPESLAEQVRQMRAVESMAGAFAIDGTSLGGVEKCYYTPVVDFTQITWTGRDMPTPFLGFAPQPGPLPGGHINRQQFRYTRDLDSPKPERTCRIFLIGGSTAFGSGASSNATTVGGYLERYLNEKEKVYGCRFEVVTAAATCWASTHERILVENFLLDLQPDVVVALSGHNDVFWGLLNCDINCYRAVQDTYYFRLTNALLRSNFKEGFPDDPQTWHQPVSASQTVSRLRRNVQLTHAALQTVGADYCYALQPILSCSHKVRTPREERMASRPQAMPALHDDTEFVTRFADCRTAMAALTLPHYHFWDLTTVFNGFSGDAFIDRCHFGDRGYDQIAQALNGLLAPVLQARLNLPRQ